MSLNIEKGNSGRYRIRTSSKIRIGDTLLVTPIIEKPTESVRLITELRLDSCRSTKMHSESIRNSSVVAESKDWVLSFEEEDEGASTKIFVGDRQHRADQRRRTVLKRRGVAERFPRKTPH